MADTIGFEETQESQDQNLQDRGGKGGRDEAWAHATMPDPKNRSKTKCIYCHNVYSGGINRHKKHLAGGDRDVKGCTKCPPQVKEQMKKALEGKNRLKNSLSHQPSTYNVEEEDDAGMMPPPSKSQRLTASSTSSTGRNTGVKGAIHRFFPQQPKSGDGASATQDFLRDRAVTAFARWMYDAALPFNCVNYESFGDFIEAVGQFGPGMKPPTYHEVRVTYLEKEVQETKKIIDEHRVEWNAHGCSLMFDKWTAKDGRMIINVLVNSPRGSLFLGTHNASTESTDANKMFSLFDKTIREIGPQNVVQIVTDNASENVKAGKMMMGAYPHIYWTPCAAHCVNLIFGDIFKEKPFDDAFGKATKIHAFIVQRPLLLNLMRRFTNQRNLVKPAKTRFATAFLTLSSFYLQKSNLRHMILSKEWEESKYSKEASGKKVKEYLMASSFWNAVVHSLEVGSPLMKVLRIVDGEQKPPMGYIYEAMDRAVEAIRKALDEKGLSSRYKKVFEIIENRWSDQLHQPLHAAGHLLNPGFYYEHALKNTLSKGVWSGFNQCLARLVSDPKEQDEIAEEMDKYTGAEGDFGLEQAVRRRGSTSPVNWWKQFGSEVPNLQRFAIKVLSLTCSASGCERNWSAFDHIHTKKRNRLDLNRLNDLVFIKYNRTLKRRFERRGKVDPIISMASIDESNEWLTGAPDDEDEEVYIGSDLRWGIVTYASGIDEDHYYLRRLSRDSGKAVASSSRHLIDETEEEDESQYPDEDVPQELENLQEE